MSNTDKHYRMPMYIKVAISNEINPHRRGELKRSMIDADVAQRRFKLQRRFTAEKSTEAAE